MATPYKTVDAYVKGAVPAKLRPVLEAVRDVMRSAAPKASEVISYGIPLWKQNHHLAFVGSVKSDIKLGFVDGLAMDDKYGLLKGRGKVTRHLVFKTVEDVKPTVLRYYIRQALKFDAARAPSPKVKS